MRYLADVHISPITIGALRAQGYDISRVTEFLPPTATDRELLDLADGNYWHNPNSAFAADVIKQYEGRFNAPFQSHTVWGYNAALVLIDALERAASTHPAKLRDAIAKTTLKQHIAPGEAIVFNDQGQNLNATVTMPQIQNGKIRVLLPKPYADAEPIFPIPGWSKV